AVLAYLATHTGRLVTAAELRESVWPDTYVSEGLLRGYIREVRQILGDDAETPRFIETVARRGYRFIAPLTTQHHSQGLGVGGQGSVRELQGNVDRSTPPSAFLLTPDPRSPAPVLVGRDRELRQLHQWLAKAAGGMRQVVFVSGEP